MFSGVKLSIRSFVLFLTLLKYQTENEAVFYFQNMCVQSY